MTRRVHAVAHRQREAIALRLGAVVLVHDRRARLDLVHPELHRLPGGATRVRLRDQAVLRRDDHLEDEPVRGSVCVERHQDGRVDQQAAAFLDDERPGEHLRGLVVHRADPDVEQDARWPVDAVRAVEDEVVAARLHPAVQLLHVVERAGEQVPLRERAGGDSGARQLRALRRSRVLHKAVLRRLLDRADDHLVLAVPVADAEVRRADCLRTGLRERERAADVGARRPVVDGEDVDVDDDRGDARRSHNPVGGLGGQREVEGLGDRVSTDLGVLTLVDDGAREDVRHREERRPMAVEEDRGVQRRPPYAVRPPQVHWIVRRRRDVLDPNDGHLRFAHRQRRQHHAVRQRHRRDRRDDRHAHRHRDAVGAVGDVQTEAVVLRTKAAVRHESRVDVVATEPVPDVRDGAVYDQRSEARRTGDAEHDLLAGRVFIGGVQPVGRHHHAAVRLDGDARVAHLRWFVVDRHQVDAELLVGQRVAGGVRNLEEEAVGARHQPQLFARRPVADLHGVHLRLGEGDDVVVGVIAADDGPAAVRGWRDGVERQPVVAVRVDGAEDVSGQRRQLGLVDGETEGGGEGRGLVVDREDCDEEAVRAGEVGRVGAVQQAEGDGIPRDAAWWGRRVDVEQAAGVDVRLGPAGDAALVEAVFASRPVIAGRRRGGAPQHHAAARIRRLQLVEDGGRVPVGVHRAEDCGADGLRAGSAPRIQAGVDGEVRRLVIDRVDGDGEEELDAMLAIRHPEDDVVADGVAVVVTVHDSADVEVGRCEEADATQRDPPDGQRTVTQTADGRQADVSAVVGIGDAQVHGGEQRAGLALKQLEAGVARDDRRERVRRMHHDAQLKRRAGGALFVDRRQLNGDDAPGGHRVARRLVRDAQLPHVALPEGIQRHLAVVGGDEPAEVGCARHVEDDPVSGRLGVDGGEHGRRDGRQRHLVDVQLQAGVFADARRRVLLPRANPHRNAEVFLALQPPAHSVEQPHHHRDVVAPRPRAAPWRRVRVPHAGGQQLAAVSVHERSQHAAVARQPVAARLTDQDGRATAQRRRVVRELQPLARQRVADAARALHRQRRVARYHFHLLERHLAAQRQRDEESVGRRVVADEQPDAVERRTAAAEVLVCHAAAAGRRVVVAGELCGRQAARQLRQRVRVENSHRAAIVRIAAQLQVRQIQTHGASVRNPDRVVRPNDRLGRHWRPTVARSDQQRRQADDKPHRPWRDYH